MMVMAVQDICFQDYQDALSSMKITIKPFPGVSPVTYEMKDGRFYVEAKDVDDVMENVVKSQARHLRFGMPWYFTNYHSLAEEIAQRVVDSRRKDLVEEDGTIMINRVRPELGSLYKQYNLQELSESDEYQEKVDLMIKDLSKMGYFDIENAVENRIQDLTPTAPGTTPYLKVLKTKVGVIKVEDVFKMTLGDWSREFVERGYGWGSYIFANAMAVGLEKEVEREFIERVKNVYDNTYVVAHEYFSRSCSPAESHKKAIEAVAKGGLKRILQSDRDDADCLESIRSATLYSCQNLMPGLSINGQTASLKV